jgi:hypothetical protein
MSTKKLPIKFTARIIDEACIPDKYKAYPQHIGEDDFDAIVQCNREIFSRKDMTFHEMLQPAHQEDNRNAIERNFRGWLSMNLAVTASVDPSLTFREQSSALSKKIDIHEGDVLIVSYTKDINNKLQFKLKYHVHP